MPGYVSGPAAATEATARALRHVGRARALILVEGVSDQIAVETLAAHQGRALADDGIVVVPIGGAQAIVRYLPQFLDGRPGLTVAGLCDEAEEEVFRRALSVTGYGPLLTRSDLAEVGFHVCVEDLEDELIRANTPERVLSCLEAEGDLGSFRTLQKQPAWRGRPIQAQLRRFMGSGGRRKSRYARLLVLSLAAEQVPRPLAAVLDHVG